MNQMAAAQLLPPLRRTVLQWTTWHCIMQPASPYEAKKKRDVPLRTEGARKYEWVAEGGAAGTVHSSSRGKNTKNTNYYSSEY